MEKYYSIKRKVHYYETDAMAIVHHSNYLRFFEEARVAWFNDRSLVRELNGEKAFFPLVESHAKYKKPARFDDEIEIRIQARLVGARYHFQYGVFKLVKGEEPLLLATGGTTHVLVDKDFKVNKTPPQRMVDAMEKESWTETWP